MGAVQEEGQVGNFINWRDDWLSGIGALDDQHRVLTDGINRLVQACHDYSGSDSGDREQQKALLSELMDGLYESTREHFRFEEAMMRTEAYPGIASHVREHAMLLAELKSTFAGRLDGDRCSMDPDILKALKSWFIGHVSHSDREFAMYMKKQTVAE